MTFALISIAALVLGYLGRSLMHAKGLDRRLDGNIHEPRWLQRIGPFLSIARFVIAAAGFVAGIVLHFVPLILIGGVALGADAAETIRRRVRRTKAEQR